MMPVKADHAYATYVYVALSMVFLDSNGALLSCLVKLDFSSYATTYTVKTVVWNSYYSGMYFIPNLVIPIIFNGMKHFRILYTPHPYGFHTNVINASKCNNKGLFSISATLN